MLTCETISFQRIRRRNRFTFAAAAIAATLDNPGQPFGETPAWGCRPGGGSGRPTGKTGSPALISPSIGAAAKSCLVFSIWHEMTGVNASPFNCYPSTCRVLVMWKVMKLLFQKRTRHALSLQKGHPIWMSNPSSHTLRPSSTYDSTIVS